MATCTINCDTQDAIIRYTTNGNDPTESDTVYSVPFSVNEGTTVKAKAWKEGMNPSAVASAEAPEELQPTSVPLGSVLSDGSVVIYDRGSSYGDYNLTSGVLMRLSTGIDDETATSDNWRFLIADSADMEGNNGGVGQNKPWGTTDSIEGVDTNSGLGYGLPHTNALITALGNNQSYLWYQVSQKRQNSNHKWFVPSCTEMAQAVGELDNVESQSYFSSEYSSGVTLGSLVSALNLSSGGETISIAPTSTDCRVRLFRRY